MTIYVLCDWTMQKRWFILFVTANGLNKCGIYSQLVIFWVFFQTDLTNWLKLNLSSRFVIGGIAWSQYFGVNTLDHLWWALERLYFQPEMDSYEWSCGYGASYGSWDPKKPTKSTCTSFAKHGLSLSRDVCYFYSLPFLLCNPKWRRLM